MRDECSRIKQHQKKMLILKNRDARQLAPRDVSAMAVTILHKIIAKQSNR